LLVAETTSTAYDPFIAPGLVVATDPAAGTPVAHQGTVTLLLSAGPEPLEVPTLVGLTEEQAREAVEGASFTLGDGEYRFNSEAKGTVIAAIGADGVDLSKAESYGDQQPVTLIVSLGPIPDV